MRAKTKKSEFAIEHIEGRDRALVPEVPVPWLAWGVGKLCGHLCGSHALRLPQLCPAKPFIFTLL